MSNITAHAKASYIAWIDLQDRYTTAPDGDVDLSTRQGKIIDDILSVFNLFSSNINNTWDSLQTGK